MMTLNYIHKECIVDFKFTESQEEIDRLMYVNDIKILGKNEKKKKKKKKLGDSDTKR